MIDPIRFTNYDRSKEELEEALLFCILVAGKNAARTSISLENLLNFGRNLSSEKSPFKLIDFIGEKKLPGVMRSFGIGCFNRKAEYLLFAANSGLDLKTCSVESLESLKGIGSKTARYFILHTRKNARVACLDTHLLSFMRNLGLDAPKSTPTKKKYSILENQFLNLCDKLCKSPAELDLMIWNHYSKNLKSEDSYVLLESIKVEDFD